jgi:hypothetical protein
MNGKTATTIRRYCKFDTSVTPKQLKRTWKKMNRKQRPFFNHVLHLAIAGNLQPLT